MQKDQYWDGLSAMKK